MSSISADSPRCPVHPQRGVVITWNPISIPIEPDNAETIRFDDIGLIPMGESSYVRDVEREGVLLDLSMGAE